MKIPMRVIAVSLWFAPVLVCVVYSLFDGFTHENYGFALFVHNGLNPKVYTHESSGLWISVVLSVLILAYVSLAPKRTIPDVGLLCFVILSYVFAGVYFVQNFHPG